MNNIAQATVLITDACRGSAMSFIRSLGRKGYRVIPADSDPHSLGFLSRYSKDRMVYPAPETYPHEFISELLKVVKEMQVDLVIPVTDAVILPLSEARDQFSDTCQLAIPPRRELEIVTNKQKTLELAVRCGVPAPRTCLVHSLQEAEQALREFDWPIVLKPMVSRLYKSGVNIEALTVSYADNPIRLAEQMLRLEGRCPVLLQEYYSGIGYGVELLMHEGKPLAAFQHKRLREIPVTGGASAMRESVSLNQHLLDYSIRLLQLLNWTGLAMVEFKVGKEGPKLMEINGRVWGSLPLAVHSGMDFPSRLVDLYLSGPPASNHLPDTDYRIGVRSRNLELEISWIGSVLLGKKRYPFLPIPPRRKGFSALLELFSPSCKFDILSMDDPVPGVGEVLRIISKDFKKMRAMHQE